jgi:class 3 adenylate cyclase
MNSFNASLEQNHYLPLNVTISIASSPAFVGNIGSHTSRKFKAFGDCNRVTEEMGRVVQYLDVDLVVDQNVSQFAGQDVVLQPLDVNISGTNVYGVHITQELTIQ